jgi:uncharacterized protein
MMLFDSGYMLWVLLPGMLISGIASFKVKSAFRKYRRVPASSGLTGAQAAARMLQANEIPDVRIEEIGGMLSDHYDPRKRVLRLSPDVYNGRSLSALGVACHEAGHALQHARGYTPLYLRSALVPVASFGSNAGVWLMIGGSILEGMTSWGPGVALLGFAAFSAAVLFSFVTLPVEFNASSRARAQLTQLGMTMGPQEDAGVSKVLNAAALTYVAAAAVALLNLLFWAIRLGLIGGSDD